MSEDRAAAAAFALPRFKRGRYVAGGPASLAHAGCQLVQRSGRASHGHLDLAYRIGQTRTTASDRNTVAFIVDQLSTEGVVTAKPMFGENGLYGDGKMFGMICDDRLFIKPTVGGRAFAGDIVEAAPYTRAKPCLLVDPARWDDADWLGELVRITTAALPHPNPKAPSKAKLS